MKNKYAFWVVTIIAFVLLIYTLVSTVILPVTTKNPLPKAVIRTSQPAAKEKEKGNKNKEKAKESNDDVARVSMPDSLNAKSGKDAVNKLFELRQMENLLHSRFELASDDSMYLVLDLKENKAILEMSGIWLHKAPILKAEVSNSIRMYHTEALLNWMAEPFTVRHVEASIPKIQFIEKIAPKDSIEANKMQTEPKVPKLGDVYVVFDFDRNLRVEINQNEPLDEEGTQLISGMKKQYQRAEIMKSLEGLVKLNRTPTMPQISITLSKTDATIIYKALPVKPRMILRM